MNSIYDPNIFYFIMHTRENGTTICLLKYVPHCYFIDHSTAGQYAPGHFGISFSPFFARLCQWIDYASATAATTDSGVQLSAQCTHNSEANVYAQVDKLIAIEG